MQGITLFMQPVQDLTVEDRVSRTQYQYTLEDPDGRRAEPRGRRKLVDELRTLPELRDVSQRPAGPGARHRAGDRPRHRLAPRHHAADDRRHALRRLRPAPGLDDVHAAEPVPRRPRGAAGLSPQRRRAARHLRARRQRRPAGDGAAQHDDHGRGDDGAAGHQPPGAVSRGHALVQPGAGRVARRGGPGDRRRRRGRSGCPPASRAASRARPRRSRPR